MRNRGREELGQPDAPARDVPRWRVGLTPTGTTVHRPRLRPSGAAATITSNSSPRECRSHPEVTAMKRVILPACAAIVLTVVWAASRSPGDDPKPKPDGDFAPKV